MWIEGKLMSAMVVGLVAVVGLVLSIALEFLLMPRPALSRPGAAWALHGGIWLLVYGALLSLMGRPWFSMAIVSAMLLTLILVNNAKMHSLREPFVFQDYEYFTDAIKHPRLYIPFLGWGKFGAAVVGFVGAVAVGFLGEAAPDDRFSLNGQFGAVIVLLLFGLSAVWAGKRARMALTLVPEEDLCRLGLLAHFWRYGEEERKFPSVRSPFDIDEKEQVGTQPHLVAIQSESFFDARDLYSGIRADVLSEYDALKAGAKAAGKMKVPAWGANTVRTEFSFLSGIASEKLGVHRFNPYRAVAAGWHVASIASLLKKRGYRTVAIHPYPVSFYRRDQVYPRIGFDEFIDVEAFSEQDRSGPYTGDMAVADKIREVLKDASGPVFIFVITMENHGPLHLETVTLADIDKYYQTPPPAGCDDLTVYLRHLSNANLMIKSLRDTLQALPTEAELCWYGDHVPIMPAVYQEFGVPNGEVEYVLWSNRKPNFRLTDEMDVSSLANHWINQHSQILYR